MSKIQHAILFSIFKNSARVLSSAMSVLIFTIFVSMMLAAFFVGAFLYHHDYSGGDSMRDSLLPFKKEKPLADKAKVTAGEDTNSKTSTKNHLPNNT